ncbi:SPOR domain-containing protein [Anaerovorax odorimutans]|uniref:SPOR domain-containing protein n=1 Tax=Anaerovorax odorimutans TaxID=109327 RepID=A0ABT1RQ81_9FIRM|nr:SPOR domain-containing protein [Anaerovorax odorimutans]MCQ4637355.1 SPOR domain-containing protein [Anaerovorax odorimutans]
MNRRRKIKRRPRGYGGKKIQVNFAPIIVIICLSVCAGYLTAKYVVYPILGYEPAGLSILQKKDGEEKKDETQKTEESSAAAQTETTAAPTAAETTTAPPAVVEDQVDVKQTAGYALQFGSYTTKEAAQKSVKQLKSSGIKAKVVEKDGAYKVIGDLFDTKEKAKAALEKMDESVGAFVTTIEK